MDTKSLLFILALIAILAVSLCSCIQIEELEKVNFYVLSNTEKLKQTDIPTTPKNGAQVSLTASLAKNESEGMQFLLRFETDISNVKVTLSDLVGKDGAKIPSVTVYRQRYIYASENKDLEKGMYPDALIPMFDGSDGGFKNDLCDIAANTNQGFWITVGTNSDTEAGIYTGTLTVSADDISDIIVPVEVEVWDFCVPEQISMQTEYGIWNPDYYADCGIDAYEFSDMCWDFFLDYRVCMNNIPHRVNVGNDPEGYVAEIVAYIEKHPSINSFNIPLFGFSLDGNFTIEDITENEINKRLYAAIKEAGLTEMAFFYVIDEPADTPENYEIIRKLGTATSIVAPGVKNVMTAYPDKYAEYMNLMVPRWDTTDEIMCRRWQEKGINVWWYGCVVPYVPYPTYHINDNMLSPRISHWMQKDYGFTGNLFWAATLFSKYSEAQRKYVPRDVWNDSASFPAVAGDGFLCYPGKENDGIVGRNMLVPSIRLESIRDGMEDYEYLCLEEKKIQSSVEKYGLPVTADDVLDTYYDVLYNRMNDYGNDTSLFEDVRSILAHDIMADCDAVVYLQRAAERIIVYADKNAEVKVDGVAIQKTDCGTYAKFIYDIESLEKKTYTVSVNNCEYKRIFIPVNGNCATEALKTRLYDIAASLGIQDSVTEKTLLDMTSCSTDTYRKAVKSILRENAGVFVSSVHDIANPDIFYVSVYAPVGAEVSVNGSAASKIGETDKYFLYSSLIDCAGGTDVLFEVSYTLSGETVKSTFCVHQNIKKSVQLFDFTDADTLKALSDISTNKATKGGYSTDGKGGITCYFGSALNSLIVPFSSSIDGITDITSYDYIALTVTNDGVTSQSGFSVILMSNIAEPTLYSVPPVPVGESQTFIISFERIVESALSTPKRLRFAYLGAGGISDAYTISDIYLIEEK